MTVSDKWRAFIVSHQAVPDRPGLYGISIYPNQMSQPRGSDGRHQSVPQAARVYVIVENGDVSINDYFAPGQTFPNLGREDYEQRALEYAREKLVPSD